MLQSEYAKPTGDDQAMSSHVEAEATPAFVLPNRAPEDCKILIVDDEERIVEAFSELLSLDGYQTLSAHTGSEAMKLVGEQNPDVVILDNLSPHKA